MRISSILHTATLAFLLTAAMGTLGACVDGGKPVANQQQNRQQTPNAGFYNNPDFVPPNLLYD